MVFCQNRVMGRHQEICTCTCRNIRVFWFCADSWMLGTNEGYVVNGVQLELLSFCSFSVVIWWMIPAYAKIFVTGTFFVKADATYRTTDIPNFSKFLGPKKKLSRGSPRESMFQVLILSYIFFTSQKVDLWSIWNSSPERVRTARASQSAGVANYPQECSSQKLHPELQMQQKLQVDLLLCITNGATLHQPGMVLFSQVNFFAKLSTSAPHKNLQDSTKRLLDSRSWHNTAQRVIPPQFNNDEMLGRADLDAMRVLLSVTRN